MTKSKSTPLVESDFLLLLVLLSCVWISDLSRDRKMRKLLYETCLFHVGFTQKKNVNENKTIDLFYVSMYNLKLKKYKF